MSKQPLKTVVTMLFKEYHMSIQIVVNKTKSCACKLQPLLLWLLNLGFWFFF